MGRGGPRKEARPIYLRGETLDAVRRRAAEESRATGQKVSLRSIVRRALAAYLSQPIRAAREDR